MLLSTRKYHRHRDRRTDVVATRMKEYLKKLGAFQIGMLAGTIIGSIIGTMTAYSILQP